MFTRLFTLGRMRRPGADHPPGSPAAPHRRPGVLAAIAAALVSAVVVSAGPAAAGRGGSLTLYSEPDFRGESITLRQDVENFQYLHPWNDRARSLIVQSGTWEVCKHAGYRKCRTLTPGARIAHLGEIKYLREISSVRRVTGSAYRPPGWGDDSWDRGHRPPPPPPGHRPPRWDDDDIVWDDGHGRGNGWGQGSGKPYRLSACQQSVQDGFIQRYGRQGTISFSGGDRDGTIWWNGDAWRFRCSRDQINIWQEERW